MVHTACRLTSSKGVGYSVSQREQRQIQCRSRCNGASAACIPQAAASAFSAYGRRPPRKGRSRHLSICSICFLVQPTNRCWGHLTIPQNLRNILRSAHRDASQIHRLMRILDLLSVCRRERRTRGKRLPAEYPAESILDRSFTAKGPNEKRLTPSHCNALKEGRQMPSLCVLYPQGRSMIVAVAGPRNGLVRHGGPVRSV